ncbi:MAG: ABC transporter ATP-binding protein [Candidatus Omnitrophica bacterium]|nr:ABC transporter ATP-binding protein [Candidatus Omnitrophota bacterium]
MKIYITFRKLMQYLRALSINPAYFILPTILALLAALFEGLSMGLLIPTIKGIIGRDFNFIRELPILKDIVNLNPALLGKGNSAIFTFLIMLIFASAIAKSMLQYGSTVGLAYLGKSISNNLRKLIYNRYLSFGKLYFDQHNLGHLYSVLINFTGRVSGELVVLQSCLARVFLLLVYIVLMVAISWQLTLISISIFPILHFSVDWIIKRIRTTSQLYTEASLALSGKISNALSCIPLVKAYMHEEKEKEWFASASNRLGLLEWSFSKKSQAIAPLQEVITLLMLLIMVAATAFFVVKEKAGGLASYFVFFIVVRRAGSSFGIFNEISAGLGRASGYMAAILKVFDDKDKHFIAEGTTALKTFNANINFNHLSFSYPNREKVLKDVTFSIEKGKITAIVGPSGSGKTTLVNAIMRFYEVPPNMIMIDGMDIKEVTVKSLRELISLVSQETYLFNTTIRMNLTYGLNDDVSDEKIGEVMKKARLYDLVARLPFGLATEIGERGIKLSGGEKQRISIARAILKNSEILILDEATSSLDTATEHLIQEAISEMIRDKTAIVIAHRLSTIKNADKVVVLEDGRIIEQGKLQELLERRGRFFNYWEKQKFN